MANSVYDLLACLEDGIVRLRLCDLKMGRTLSDGPYVYRATKHCDEGRFTAERLTNAQVLLDDRTIRIRGALAGLELEHIFTLPSDAAFMEERIILRNPTDAMLSLSDFASGFRCRISDFAGSVLPEFADNRVIAVPFRRRPDAQPGQVNDFLMSEFITSCSKELRCENLRQGYMPSFNRFSEGWAWQSVDYTLGIFKFSQETLEFSVLSVEVDDKGLYLRFGGTAMISGEPSVFGRIAPQQTVELGITRYQTLEGDYKNAFYAFRKMLDDRACRFPEAYNPPVHWNELYDNAEWWLTTPGSPTLSRGKTRPIVYRREDIEREAEKAQQYHCEALYLDPGWDTMIGSFIWAEQWLGNIERFVEDMRNKYGLQVSLHCPLGPWVSATVYEGYSPAVSWPKESARMDADGNMVKDSVCLGSRQYIETATERLSQLCDAGVRFLMFDGNWWTGGCWNLDHGHPVPYQREDHIRANLALCQAVHARHPNVIIEMHDMIAGGTPVRATPVYYKYGLPNSYDENWGFEFMWNPIQDLRDGQARSLYYYNLGCNVPVYLHIDLRTDNENCVVFWWFASTCRHLGIGGSHSNHLIAERQKHEMCRYRSLERFFKRGEFYGISEEIHLHVLAEENAFVVNVFNLSDEPRLIQGKMNVSEIGIDPDRWYARSGQFCGFDSKNGTFNISWPMKPWSAELAEFYDIESVSQGSVQSFSHLGKW